VSETDEDVVLAGPAFLGEYDNTPCTPDSSQSAETAPVRPSRTAIRPASAEHGRTRLGRV